MIPYLGDIAPGQVLRFLWPTAGLSGQSITRATDGEVRVYKDNNVAQSTTGVTGTEDFDGLTGVHSCQVDTSADGAFYAAGSDYTIVLAGAVIDGVTVNTPIAHFSIRNRSAWQIGSVIAGYIDTEIASILAAVAPGIADIKAQTDLIPAAPAAQGDIPSAATIADAVWALANAIDGKTPAEVLMLMGAVLLGKSSGVDTGNPVYRALDDSKDRVSGTSNNGNRTAVVLDAT